MTTAIIDLTDDEFKELQDLTSVNDAAAAVRSALGEYRRYARRMRLKQLSGHIGFVDNWRALEAAEIEESRPG